MVYCVHMTGELATSYAKKLRKNATLPETIIRSFLKGVGIKHRFQRTIRVSPGNYRFADFYFPALRLIIEIDGKYHDNPGQQAKDRYREDEILRVRNSFSIARFTNQEVLSNPEMVIDFLLERMKERFYEVKGTTKKLRIA
jgi:very-short-patch-repair endonuclease